LKIKRTHPFSEIETLVESLEKEDTPFNRERHLLVLPDNISINNLKTYVSRNKLEIKNKLIFETFESIAKKIIKEKRNHDPSVLENHYLRVFVTQYIQDSLKSSDISSKIHNIIKKSERPERTPLIEDLVREFSDYLRTVYPPSLKDSSIRDFHSDLIEIADSGEIDNYESDKAINMLEFFSKIESYIQNQMDDHFNDGHYLSRYHLVCEAVEEIKRDDSLLEKVLDGIESVRVLAIPIFDPTTIGLLGPINKKYDEVKVITGKGTHDRLKKRFENIFDDVEVSIEKDEIKDDNVEKWELPNPRQEVEFVGSLMQDEVEVDESIVIARESSVYLPYANEVLRDFGLPSHVQTRRNLSLSIPFRLVASLLNLIEKDKWTIEDISNPLRLGFSFYHRDGSDREVGILSDHLFLEAEYWLNKVLGRGEEELSPEEWKQRTRYDTEYYIKKLIEWKDEVDEDNITDKLKSELGKFQKYACHVKRKREARNGLSEKEYNRSEITKTHMTGDAQRVIGLIDRADDFSNFISKIEGASSRTVRHMIKAFWIVGGGETFGEPRREKKAVKFVDAANSFFLPEKKRIIVGMRSGTFPREAPEVKFLPTSFRETVNEEYERLYLQDPETDYENELDFFEAAIGPENEDKKIYQLNPYLDDRGHKNHWSVFSADVEPTHFRPADFYLDSPTKKGENFDYRGLLSYKPKSRWQKSIDKYRKDEKLSKEDLLYYFENIEYDIMKFRINPRVEKYEERIKNSRPRIEPPNPKKEKYLENMIEEQKNEPVPSHEIDLWIDCPIKYYFYRFVFYQPHWDKDWKEDEKYFEKGSRFFIPEYWYDFDLGDIPEILMRAYMSSSGHKFIKTNFEEYLNHNHSSSEIKSELEKAKLSDNTKENIECIIDHFENIDTKKSIKMGEKNEWMWEESKNMDYIKPPFFIFDFWKDRPNPGEINKKWCRLFIGRYKHSFYTCQKGRFKYSNWIPKEKVYSGKALFESSGNNRDLPLPLKNLQGVSDDRKILEDLVDNIQSLQPLEGDRNIVVYNDRKCDDCKYQRLCGDWEVVQ